MPEQPVVAVVLSPAATQGSQGATGYDAPPPGLDDALGDEAELRYASSGDEVAKALSDADVALVWDISTPHFLEAFPRAERLRWAHAASAGVDVVVSEDVVHAGVTVTNSRGIFDPGIAEWVLGTMLLFAKDLLGSLHLQRERTWEHRDSEMLRGKRLLVVGAGSIGREVAKLAKAAGVRVSGIARSERPDDPDFGRVAPQDELHERLPEADYVVVTAPLTDETRDMFGPDEFRAMRSTARFLNVGRGPIHQEDALVDALREGEIAGAGLDVFETEPLPGSSPLWTMPNVFVSPHQSGDYIGWTETLVELFVDNFRRFVRGDELRNVVDTHKALALKGTSE